MTNLEEKLQRYRDPSSTTEKDKQDRAERMVRAAVNAWSSENDIPVSFMVKGSYANNTNVRQDSDVDIAVIHGRFHYYDDSLLRDADKINGSATMRRFEGSNFRVNLERFLKEKFGDSCDITGSTAIELSENSGRVSADIVPSYMFRRYGYDSAGRVAHVDGQKVYRKNGTTVVNYPQQQLDNGVAKNLATKTRYKQLVRIYKRFENDFVKQGTIKALPSYFMECLVYATPDYCFGSQSSTPLSDDLKSVTAYLAVNTAEGKSTSSWFEPNGIKPLFGDSQKWTQAQANQLAYAIWAECGFSNA